MTFFRYSIRGWFYYLYLVIDAYSSRVVAGEFYQTESTEHAPEIITNACIRHGISTTNTPLVLHSDNDTAMKGRVMLLTLQRLGVVSLFSHPRFSDDNPYSEAISRVFKCRPCFPRKPFANIEVARNRVYDFAQRCNAEHNHSRLRFLTLVKLYRGESEVFMSSRERLASRQNCEAINAGVRGQKEIGA
ncbi:MAG: DDE-type integrase/transposase/recombinase [Candidatus Endonucleobacter sp. (ex Gigantidas childressi)]|nr:DDE-type integrase/transposase/recombinase [Candidatus Endonucleobacter sp. (ex Gigantidas childressi)]